MDKKEFDWKRLIAQYKIVRKKQYLATEQMKALRQDILDNWPMGAKELTVEDERFKTWDTFNKWEFSPELQAKIEQEKESGVAKKVTLPMFVLQEKTDKGDWIPFIHLLKKGKS